MKKPIIGIIPTIKLKRNDNPYDDIYKFVDSYSSRIIEQNAMPIGLLLKEGSLDKDILDICDGFLFPGGNKVEKIHYEVLEYAIKKNKPVLGICLGMQAMACYSCLKEKANKRNIKPSEENLMKLRKELQEDNIYMLEQLHPGHIHGEKIMNEEVELTRENLLSSIHPITILSNTKLYECFKTNSMNIISMHSYRIYSCGPEFKVSATAEDGTIEAIEATNNNLWIVGVQFHPELEKDNLLLTSFIEETKKRIM